MIALRHAGRPYTTADELDALERELDQEDIERETGRAAQRWAATLEVVAHAEAHAEGSTRGKAFISTPVSGLVFVRGGLAAIQGGVGSLKTRVAAWFVRIISKTTRVVMATWELRPDELAALVGPLPRGARVGYSWRPARTPKDFVSWLDKILSSSERPDFVVFDYVQRIPRRTVAYFDELASIVEACEERARNVGVTVLVLSQINRQSRGKPRIGSAEGSATLEECADLLLGLEEAPGGAWLSVQKDRHSGRSGQEWFLALRDPLKNEIEVDKNRFRVRPSASGVRCPRTPDSPRTPDTDSPAAQAAPDELIARARKAFFQEGANSCRKLGKVLGIGHTKAAELLKRIK
jgi:hypothetical protein